MTRSGSNGDHGTAGTATVVGDPVAQRDGGDGFAAGTVDVEDSHVEASGDDGQQGASSDFPAPAVLSNPEPFVWDQDRPVFEKYLALGGAVINKTKNE